MEKCSSIGLISIATVDFIFCMVTLCDSLLLGNNIIYREKNITYFFSVYGNYIQNVLIKVSTWCTVIIAVSRYMIVCYPMKARLFMKPVHTVVAILISLAACSLLHVPLLWIWKVKEVSCHDGNTFILLKFGLFMKHSQMRRTCLIIWFTFGFIIPVAILLYSNIGLIKSLNHSRKLQRTASGPSNRFRDQHRRISMTLVGIVVLFFICMCPGEILGFYTDLSSAKTSTYTFAIVLVLCNMLQAINFSGNFALYCVINSYFRRDVKHLISCQQGVIRQSSTRSSISRSYTPQARHGTLITKLSSTTETDV